MVTARRFHLEELVLSLAVASWFLALAVMTSLFVLVVGCQAVARQFRAVRRALRRPEAVSTLTASSLPSTGARAA